MGSRTGSELTAARRVGVSLEEYQRRVAAGEKWCIGHKAWHPRSEFQVDRSRGDGLKARCRACPSKDVERDPLRLKARGAVRYAVYKRRIPAAWDLPCVDCGHIANGDEVGAHRRHQYDHYLGYEPEHWLDVQAVCSLCHADREKARRTEEYALRYGRRAG